MGYISQKPIWIPELKRKIYYINAIAPKKDRIERLPRMFINEIKLNMDIQEFELYLINGLCIVLVPYNNYLNAEKIQPINDINITISGKYDSEYQRLTIPIEMLNKVNLVKIKKEDNKKIILSHDTIRNVAEIWTVEGFEIFKKVIKSHDIMGWAKSISINRQIPIPIIIPLNDTWVGIIGYYKLDKKVIFRYINIKDDSITAWCHNSLPIILNTISKNIELYDVIYNHYLKYIKHEVFSRDNDVFNFSKRLDDVENITNEAKKAYEKIMDIVKDIK